jgi:nicotinamidase-related amidase
MARDADAARPIPLNPEETVSNDQAKQALEMLAQRPAALTIDMHRGHLDPEVATLPLAPDASSALMERTVALLQEYRRMGIPVFHVTTVYRDREEILSNPYWRFQAGRADSARAAIAEHNLDHLPGIELMPGIREGSEPVIATKKRYDCFFNTDLELTLRSHGIDSLLVFGVNTSSCVIATSLSASVRDYAVFVVEDGVDTMLGVELHNAANLVIAQSFGWVVDGQTTLDVLGARAGAAR